MAEPSTGLEHTLASLCDLNKCCDVSVGFKRTETYPDGMFFAFLMWLLPPGGADRYDCTTGEGPTMQDAMTDAIKRMEAKRA